MMCVVGRELWRTYRQIYHKLSSSFKGTFKVALYVYHFKTLVEIAWETCFFNICKISSNANQHKYILNDNLMIDLYIYFYIFFSLFYKWKTWKVPFNQISFSSRLPAWSTESSSQHIKVEETGFQCMYSSMNIMM